MVKKSANILIQTVRKLWSHPRPWIFRYVVSLGPAFIFAIIITLSSWKILTQPYMSQLLGQRNIDMLFDILIHLRERESDLLLPFILSALAVLVWIPVQIAYIWLEGGTLCSYASDNPLGWHEFYYAGNKWFGFMFIVKSISTLLMVCIFVLAIAIAAVLRKLWAPLMWFVAGSSFLVSASVYLLFEIVRATAVVRGERRIRHVLQHSFEYITKDFAPIFLILVLSSICIGLLVLLQRWISTTVPISWWLISFIILQVIAIIRYGLRLLRQCSEIIFIQSQS